MLDSDPIKVKMESVLKPVKICLVGLIAYLQMVYGLPVIKNAEKLCPISLILIIENINGKTAV